MFGFSLIRTGKLAAIYEWLAKLSLDKIRNQNTLIMEIKGKIIKNLGIQSGTSKAGNAWSKASIVIETDGQFPKKVMLDNLKNADEFGKLAVGSYGTFHIELNSTEFNGRWYTSVNCWKWEVDQPQPAMAQSATSNFDSPGVQGYQQSQGQPAPQTDDDLPF